MNVIFLLFFSLVQPAYSWSEDKLKKKKDEWLIKKSKSSPKVEDMELLLNEMGNRKNKIFISPLVNALESKEGSVRLSAINSMAKIDASISDNSRDKAYLTHLSDRNSRVSKKASEAIRMRIDSMNQTAFLMNNLKRFCKESSSWMNRRSAIQILQWVEADKKKIDALIMDRLQLDQNPEVRRSAAIALGNRKTTEARKLLYKAKTKDLDKLVRTAAEGALKKIGGKVENITLAVMPFDFKQPEAKKYAEGLESYLPSSLSASKVAKVVERTDVDKVMKELKYQDSFINDGKAVDIGKSLRASQVVTGTVQLYDSKLVLIVKRIDVKTQEIISSTQHSGLVIDFDSLQRDLSRKFIDTF